jgi:diadenosine tetraphosphate (Ap4A) HIT family hydrolase
MLKGLKQVRIVACNSSFSTQKVSSGSFMDKSSEFSLDPRLEKESFFICELDLCELRIINDQNYPWFILVPKVNDVREIYQLPEFSRAILEQEIFCISKALAEHFNAFKTNIAALGNLVAQLHIHIIIRYETDISWPNPVWGQFPVSPYNAAQAKKIVESVRNLVSSGALPEDSASIFSK